MRAKRQPGHPVSHFSYPVHQPAVQLRQALRKDVIAAVTRCATLLPEAAISVVSDALNASQADQAQTPSSAAIDRERGLEPGAVTCLLYELLDAHDDTAQMASELTQDPLWQAHLEYLRALQRKGRETLARMDLDRAA